LSFQAVVEIPTSVRRWKSYLSYKDSDIEWLGKIPAHWETKAVWILFRLGRGRVISNEEILDNPGPYPVYSSQTENEGIMGYIDTYDFDGNYITWTTDGANAGTVFHRAGKFNCTNVCGTLFAQRSDINLRYFAHALNLATSWFVRHDINPKLMNNVMARIRVQVPPAAEQRCIATFLDRETAKISALVAKKERLIALLQEKRAALITRAVTKGLPSTDSGQATPNVPMKHSGVEWLGEIPAHWSVKQLRWTVMFQRGHDLPTDKREDGEVPVVTSSGISSTHSKAVAQSPGIVTGRYGTIGQFHLITENYWPLNTTLYSIKLYENNPRFLQYMLSHMSPLFLLNAVKSAVPGIDRNDIHPIRTAVPPTAEQEVIAEFLNRETAKIDAAHRQDPRGHRALERVPHGAHIRRRDRQDRRARGCWRRLTFPPT
jgi:type I restriction enzyme, S subunit